MRRLINSFKNKTMKTQELPTISPMSKALEITSQIKSKYKIVSSKTYSLRNSDSHMIIQIKVSAENWFNSQWFENFEYKKEMTNTLILTDSVIVNLMFNL